METRRSAYPTADIRARCMVYGCRKQLPDAETHAVDRQNTEDALLSLTHTHSDTYLSDTSLRCTLPA